MGADLADPHVREGERATESGAEGGGRGRETAAAMRRSRGSVGAAAVSAAYWCLALLMACPALGGRCDGAGVFMGGGNFFGKGEFASPGGSFSGNGSFSGTDSTFLGTGNCTGEGTFTAMDGARVIITGTGIFNGTGKFQTRRGDVFVGTGAIESIDMIFIGDGQLFGKGKIDGFGTSFGNLTCKGQGTLQGDGEFNGDGSMNGTGTFTGDGGFLGQGILLGIGSCSGGDAHVVESLPTAADFITPETEYAEEAEELIEKDMK